jgi:hypothetical protein
MIEIVLEVPLKIRMRGNNVYDILDLRNGQQETNVIVRRFAPSSTVVRIYNC